MNQHESFRRMKNEAEANELDVIWRDAGDFRVMSWFALGKYCKVFEAMDMKALENHRVVLKCLKPVPYRKIYREIMILSRLKHCLRIITLEGVVRDPDSLTLTLVMEYCGADAHWLSHSGSGTLSKEEIRLYMHQLLDALRECHKNGIMHRDVKHKNIIINRTTGILRLIDFGLAEEYKEGTSYPTMVASRHFKAPELLLGNTRYDYSIDMWSAGCVFAGLLFIREPFFRGVDVSDQLSEIARVLGSDEIDTVSVSVAVEEGLLEGSLLRAGRLAPYEKKPWTAFMNEKNEKLVDDIALDLLNQMLQIDPRKRINVTEALKHHYFSP